MRLADHIIAAPGTQADEQFCGAFTNIAPSVRAAEKFELTDDVAMAAYQLTRSKPSALVQAMPMCRMPYPKIWLEWRGGILGDSKRNDPLFNTPNPAKQGCLIEGDETGTVGVMTFAWVHKDSSVHAPQPLNLAPIGTMFNWNLSVDLRLAGLQTGDIIMQSAGGKLKFRHVLEGMLALRYAQPLDDDGARSIMRRLTFKGWDKLVNDPREVEAMKDLNKRGMPCLSPFTRNFVHWLADMVTSEENVNRFMNEVLHAWEADVEGEPSMVEAVIALMNSRNAVEHRPVDLARLNKMRAKRRRPTFAQYRTTHLRLSQAQQRAFRAGLLSREDAGLHRVRGHFKIRKTGIYWWSPFFRGDPTRPAMRDEYKMEAS